MVADCRNGTDKSFWTDGQSPVAEGEYPRLVGAPEQAENGCSTSSATSRYDDLAWLEERRIGSSFDADLIGINAFSIPVVWLFSVLLA
jgi:hypothetical protein